MAVPTSEAPRHLGAVANAYLTKAEEQYKCTIPVGQEHTFRGLLGNYSLRRRTHGTEVDLRVVGDNGDNVAHYVLSGAGAIRDPEQHNSTVDRRQPLVGAIIVDIWDAKTDLYKASKAQVAA